MTHPNNRRRSRLVIVAAVLLVALAGLVGWHLASQERASGLVEALSGVDWPSDYVVTIDSRDRSLFGCTSGSCPWAQADVGVPGLPSLVALEGQVVDLLSAAGAAVRRGSGCAESNDDVGIPICTFQGSMAGADMNVSVLRDNSGGGRIIVNLDG